MDTDCGLASVGQELEVCSVLLFRFRVPHEAALNRWQQLLFSVKPLRLSVASHTDLSTGALVCTSQT